MTDVRPFALLLLVVAAAALLALLSGRAGARARVPAPALFLAAAAVGHSVLGGDVPFRLVERVVTVALLCILFDGGLHIGWRRARRSATPVLLIGVAGTFLTAAALATAAHLLVGTSWYLSLLLGTALAPTDPAVVFSVLGQREVAGRSGTILEGESGANDPVGIALMASLLGAGSLSGAALANVGLEFLLQMMVGVAMGLVGGRLLLVFMRRVSLPNEGLYPLRTLAFVLGLYGLATLAHGSGFLAVFLAGIVLGDARAPFKRDIELFHGALASIAEIVAFVALGLTVPLGRLGHSEVWLPALALFALLTLLIRPLAAGVCLLGSGLRRGEKAFVLFAGLKGAVPILLGFLLLDEHLADATRLYGIVVVVVMLSVLLQGGLLPTAARMLGVPMRDIPQQPFTFGVRLVDEPEGALRLQVEPGSAADGVSVDALCEATDERHAWVNMLVRDQSLVPVRGSTMLQAGDEVLLTASPASHERLTRAFTVGTR